MPELPEVTVYVEALERRIRGATLERVRLQSPSLLKTFDPPISAAEGQRVLGLRRMAKRIVWELDGELYMVFHLMITGRLRWRERGTAVPRKPGHAAFDFANGSVLLTEAGRAKQASLHLVHGATSLASFERGGIDPLEASLEEFRTALVRENRSLKRALTDQRILAGIGNAYSDEILLVARLSPVKRTHQLSEDELVRLYRAVRETLQGWTDRLRSEVGDGFPEKVTAFHPAMKVHGKYGQPCPQCGSPIQRIVYAANETNYCASCQTDGKLLRDRALSRLLKDDWPSTLEELEGG
ncbi:MAG: Fpg/Nei family DNA glycosylase [Gemmatimonadota bacterium]|nr:MAG: Fpg/Nei family DNA glycosylase [Gemmatimonadota bacterium]